MPELSVIILSYNTKNITEKCLDYLVESLKREKLPAEIIVVDNGSKDGSSQMLLEYAKKLIDPNLQFQIILNKKNLGFPKGNNQGLKVAKGNTILFLNSDAYVDREINWKELLNYLENNQEVGAMTVKVVLSDGNLDPASHRGFPTIWRSLSYFSGMEKLFGRVPLLNRLFGGYHLKHLNLNHEHEIDSPSGAFFLARKSVLDRVKGFDDENFFLYGEDIDLAYRIKQFGNKIVYYPKYEVTHLKGVSGREKKDETVQKKSQEYFYDAMKIFYKKHYENKYPKLLNGLVYWGINMKRKLS